MTSRPRTVSHRPTQAQDPTGDDLRVREAFGFGYWCHAGQKRIGRRGGYPNLLFKEVHPSVCLVGSAKGGIFSVDSTLEALQG